jgi:hypothetical protein
MSELEIAKKVLCYSSILPVRLARIYLGVKYLVNKEITDKEILKVYHLIRKITKV